MRIKRLAALLILLGSPALEASDAVYSGPPLDLTYDGPIIVHNSQVRYTGSDRLTFSTREWLRDHHPELLQIRSAIDTWASRFDLHPRLLSAILSDYLRGATVTGDPRDKDAVLLVASALATGYTQQDADPLTATRAAIGVADALSFRLSLAPELSAARPAGAFVEAPILYDYFQPPWEIGETWSGGGAHGSNYNALDFWGDWVPWGGDTTPYWLTAMQTGTVRVWSSCSMSIVHPNGWVTNYYHLDNIQLADYDPVSRNDRIAHYADNEAQAICDGGWSTGPHVHMSLSYGGVATTVDESQVDFTAFSNHVGVEPYDTNCSTSWYTHFSLGQVCPNRDELLNDAPPVLAFADGFESGDTSSWSETVP